jgi:rSAM/selenodomain-associated transferase 1
MSAAIDAMRNPMGDACVMVFARAPVPGQCKTRLIPVLGEQGAAALHEKLVRRALDAACAALPAALELWCTPDATHPFFAACARDYPIALERQGEGSLGERMQRAIAQALRKHGRAIIIGSDIPGLDTAYLVSAAAALDRAPAVFGPAEDGGYVLVGLRCDTPALFEGMAWGGPQVMAQTRAQLARLGMQAIELATLRDLDRPEDLAGLQL